MVETSGQDGSENCFVSKSGNNFNMEGDPGTKRRSIRTLPLRKRLKEIENMRNSELSPMACPGLTVHHSSNPTSDSLINIQEESHTHPKDRVEETPTKSSALSKDIQFIDNSFLEKEISAIVQELPVKDAGAASPTMRCPGFTLHYSISPTSDSLKKIQEESHTYAKVKIKNKEPKAPLSDLPAESLTKMSSLSKYTQFIDKSFFEPDAQSTFRELYDTGTESPEMQLDQTRLTHPAIDVPIELHPSPFKSKISMYQSPPAFSTFDLKYQLSEEINKHALEDEFAMHSLSSCHIPAAFEKDIDGTTDSKKALSKHSTTGKRPSKQYKKTKETSVRRTEGIKANASYAQLLSEEIQKQVIGVELDIDNSADSSSAQNVHQGATDGTSNSKIPPVKDSGRKEQHTKTSTRSKNRIPRRELTRKVWFQRLIELKTYKNIHGHCMVPQKYPGNEKLGVWVNKQRMEYKLKMDNTKKSSMTDEKISALEAIGFAWAEPNGQVRWDKHYAELQAYHSNHSHANVPTKFEQNPALGRWVSTQRSEYIKFAQDLGQKTLLTREKVEKLNTLGFCWSAQNKQVPKREVVLSEV